MVRPCEKVLRRVKNLLRLYLVNSPGEGAGQAEHDDGEDDVHEIEAGEGLHQLVEVLLDLLSLVKISLGYL